MVVPARKIVKNLDLPTLVSLRRIVHIRRRRGTKDILRTYVVRFWRLTSSRQPSTKETLLLFLFHYYFVHPLVVAIVVVIFPIIACLKCFQTTTNYLLFSLFSLLCITRKR